MATVKELRTTDHEQLTTDNAQTTTDTVARVVLKRRRALPLFSRHPWVFAGAIQQVDGDPQAGDEVAVVSHDGQFIARGLFNPQSNIRVRLYDWNAGGSFDEGFWSARLDRAIELRRQLFPDADDKTAYRLVYSEADGLSGLIVDRYGDWLVVQWNSLALASRGELLLRLLEQKLQPQGMWLRTEKGVRESEGLVLSDGLLSGREPPRPLFIEEHGIRYGVDIVEGQKTGFYLDQRDNRAAVARYVKDHRVLDLFCYTGGFGLAATRLGDAKEVYAVDVSEPALTVARSHAEWNGLAERFRFEKSTAFAALERLIAAGETFDTVILDPPKLARSRAGVKKALRGYYSLNRLAVDVLRPGGILVTCSCSGLIDRAEFEEVLASVALNADRPIQVLEERGQAPDHPTSVHCREGSYLKCYICRVV